MNIPNKSKFYSARQTSNKKSKKSAFSFIEITIVILIIGVLIASVLLGLNIIEKSKLSSARNLTKNSPVNGIESLYSWLDATSEESILGSESDEGSAINIWKDIKVIGAQVNASLIGSNTPVFTKGMGLLSIGFDGTGNGLEVDATYLNDGDYTIIIVEKRSSGISDNYFIGDSSITTENENILLGYSASATVIHSHAGSKSYTSSISSYADSSSSKRIFTFQSSRSFGKKTYINGYYANSDPNADPVTNLSNLVIGKEYVGEIGEIIVFNKALSNRDRINTEAYLGQKWGIEVANSESSISCGNGILTDNGCEIACSVNIVGVLTPTSVEVGSGNLYCNDTGYNSDAIAYTCTDGTAITGDCSGSCASGYVSYNGTCQGQCSISSVLGIVDGTLIDAGVQNATCNVTSPSYSGSIAGICDNGIFTPDSEQSCTLECDSGFYPNADNTACVEGCVGGTIDTTSVPGKVIHKFLASGTFQCPTARNVEVLVVGAGGGGSAQGGGFWGAGGGGGGVVHETSFSVGSSLINVVVGMGYNGGKGGNSNFSTITAYGGGPGESSSTAQVGSAGGSSPFKYAASSVTSGQGNSGGTPCTIPNVVVSSGGGGAGSPGSNGFCDKGYPEYTSYAGKGGDGIPIDITGSEVYYGGGGGSLCHMSWSITYSQGGLGGGGSGLNGNGAPNTGGGGGSRYSGTTSPKGGSGIIIVRY